jgi:hypothetical protein
MMTMLAIMLTLLGSLFEAAGILCLVVPNLRFMVSNVIAALLIAVGGLLFASGVILLVMG